MHQPHFTQTSRALVTATFKNNRTKKAHTVSTTLEISLTLTFRIFAKLRPFLSKIKFIRGAWVRSCLKQPDLSKLLENLRSKAP